MSETLAKKYAKVLFDSAKEKNAVDEVSDNVVALDFVIQSSDFLKTLANPSFTHSQKETMIKASLENKVSKVLYEFLIFLVDKNRIGLLGEISRKFKDIFNQAKNRLEVEITTSMETDKKLQEEIIHHLGRKFQKEIIPHFKVVPEILGGIKIRIDDKVIDYTIQAQLERFNKNVVFA